ncbi:hypothetical protein F9B74_07105 [Pelistega sp. NLN82]|uniref:Uncharacterized protein n=1 Tax=Pelistega ratti TaxID=2652177 RepID=A0A6L9Y8C8_9BURK|nr:hypothetical protein [Pelistega ratti]NEN76088.1 hypothetical protein [Pelistega ratti]
MEEVYGRIVMATVMEKDVLLNFVARVLAKVTVIVGSEEPPHQDRVALARIRNFLYKSYPEALDFEVILDEIKCIESKYQ